MFSVRVFVVTLTIHHTLCATFDFDFVWSEPNKTQLNNYFARQELPEDVENATEITLSQRVPILLRRFDMSFAKKLKSLVIKNCGLSDIETGSFANVPPLVNLTITKNNIKLIKHGVFNNVSVRHLDLSHNKLTTLAPSAFDDMKDLLSLNLDYNEFTSYALWFNNCPNFTRMSIQYNFLQYIPDGLFSQLTDRKLFVYFSYNRVSKIHPEAFALAEFEDLYLDHNELEDFDVVLKKVGTLNLNVNDIQCFPEDFLKNEVKKVTRILLFENTSNCTCYEDAVKMKNVLIARPEDC